MTHKIALISAWVVNLILFTGSLWFEAYAEQAGLWHEKPLEIMCVTTGLAKAVLSVCMIYFLCQGYDSEEKRGG